MHLSGVAAHADEDSLLDAHGSMARVRADVFAQHGLVTPVRHELDSVPCRGSRGLAGVRGTGSRITILFK